MPRMGILLFIVYCLLITAASAQKSPDAIGIRVIGNPAHHSPLRWYGENIKQKGSPSELLVDGYQAIRDGRTVYVNAANYDTLASKLYTNIYVISYNQEAQSETQDIFGQMLAHWRFNTNLETAGACSASSSVACINDGDCFGLGSCSSLKAEVVRNTRRLSDIADIQTALENYKKSKGHYPILSAGSYLPNRTLSVWPSWRETLSGDLGKILPVDPINKLGACPGFDAITCWSKASSSFAGILPDDLALPVSLPASSSVYVYRATADGRAYTLSTSSVDPVTIIGSGAELTETYTNVSPQIEVRPGSTIVDGGTTYIRIAVSPGSAFSFSVRAIDPDSDLGPLALWTLNTGPAINWTSNGWSAPPVLATTSNPDIKELEAAVVGVAGNYDFTLQVSDGAGGSDFKNFRIQVINQPPIITLPAPGVSVVVGKNDLVASPYVISAVDPEGNYLLTSSLAPAALPPGLAWQVVDQTTFRVTGTPTVGAASATTTYTVTFADSYGAVSTASFDIAIVNNPPVITSSPPAAVRANSPYGYDVEATDADGHGLTYQFAATSGHPPTLAINPATGVVSGTPTASGNFNVIIEVTDDFGSTATQSYVLAVNNYCGDGIQQSTNMEGAIEDCDDGNASNVDACDTTCRWTCESKAAADFDLNIGISDSLLMDENPSPLSAIATSSGTYLKLARVMPTPYIWVANSFAANRISKIRTFSGWRKTVTGLDLSTWENRGQLLGTYPVGSNPSRTAVNVETGDVWVANRDSGNVTKLDIDGNVKKTCATGAGPRGVAIEENGDVWVGNYSGGTVVKLSGDDSNCAILETVNTGGAPYGLAIDSENNIWVSNGSVSIQKINTATLALSNFPAPGLYGITVDVNDNVWTSIAYDPPPVSGGFYKLNRGAADGTPPTRYNPPYNHLVGISTDLYGNIWSGSYDSNVIVKMDSASGAYLGAWESGGIDARGTAGDSAGQIWLINLNANIRVFDQAGSTLANYCVNDSNGNSNCTDDGIQSYTYSDMSGLNRAMLLRSGDKVFRFDSLFVDQRWGELDWQENIPGTRQIVRTYVRAGNSTSTLPTIPWTLYDRANPAGSAAARIGRFLEVKVELRSRERGVTPVVWQAEISCANPKSAVGPSCSVVDAGVCFGCVASCGGGSCSGTRMERDSCGRSYPVPCTITNPTPCPLGCSLPDTLTCTGSPSLGSPDRNNFTMSSLPANYAINGGWGFTSAYPKPTSFPATVPSGSNIAVAVSTDTYFGRLYCYEGQIYKQYASSTLSTTNTCD